MLATAHTESFSGMQADHETAMKGHLLYAPTYQAHRDLAGEMVEWYTRKSRTSGEKGSSMPVIALGLVGAVGLAWLGIASAQPAAASGPECQRSIGSGDTFWGYSRDTGIPLPNILAANPGVEPKRLQIGQIVNLPFSGCSELPTGGAVTAPKVDSKPAVVTQKNTPAPTISTLPKELILAKPGEEISIPPVNLAPGETKRVNLNLGGKADIIALTNDSDVRPGDFKMQWFNLGEQAPHGNIPEDEPPKANSTSFLRQGPNAQIISGGTPGRWELRWINKSARSITLTTSLVAKDAGCPSDVRVSLTDLPLTPTWSWCVNSDGSLTY